MRHLCGLCGALSIAIANPAGAYTELERAAALEIARAAVQPLLETLADDAFEGRNNQSPGSLAAQEFLIDQLEEIGAGIHAAEVGDDAFRQPFARGTNLLAVIPGRELPDEFVIVGAHYDHLGFGCSFFGRAESSVCNGATDNGAGSAMVVAIGRAIASLPVAPRRSVVLALWDAEEDGLLGAEHYVSAPLVPLESSVAYVNFDIQGANLLPSVRNHSFAIGTETGGALLEQLVDDAAAAHGLETHRLSVVFGQNRSDHAKFYPRGIPTVFFGDSTGGCYHSTGDEIGVVDFAKLRRQTQIGLRVVLGLAEGQSTPSFPDEVALATYEDAAAISEIINLGVADLDLFPGAAAQLRDIQGRFQAIVDAGPEAFGGGTVFDMLFDAADVVSLLTTTECDGYLLPDRDGDDVPDEQDNCVDVANPGQEDVDSGQDDDSSVAGVQHYGDACDADLDDDGGVGASDFFGSFLPCLGADLAQEPGCSEADLNRDGLVGASDFFSGLRPAFGSSPGPGVTELEETN